MSAGAIMWKYAEFGLPSVSCSPVLFVYCLAFLFHEPHMDPCIQRAELRIQDLVQQAGGTPHGLARGSAGHAL